jgi:hypothetical protein
MNRSALLECAFFIPLRRDRNLSDGEPHDIDVWQWLKDQLFDVFQGATWAPGVYIGFYRDPDTGEMIHDETRRLIVAIPKARLRDLRRLLKSVCDWFEQKCIYLSIAGTVEFIQHE